MNQLRRELIEELINMRTQKNKNLKYGEYNGLSINNNSTKSINFKVSNESQLKHLLNKKVNVYTDNIDLYNKYKQDNLFYITDRVSFNLIDLQNDNILASNLSSIIKYSKNNNIYSDIYLNVTNSYTLEVLLSLNSRKVALSIENKDDDIKSIINEFKKRMKFIPNIDILLCFIVAHKCKRFFSSGLLCIFL